MFRKILNGIEIFLIFLQELFSLIFATLIAKDPCKKCLVVACCKNKCEEKVLFENFILRGQPLIYRKILAGFIVLLLIGLIPLI